MKLDIRSYLLWLLILVCVSCKEELNNKKDPLIEKYQNKILSEDERKQLAIRIARPLLINASFNIATNSFLKGFESDSFIYYLYGYKYDISNPKVVEVPDTLLNIPYYEVYEEYISSVLLIVKPNGKTYLLSPIDKSDFFSLIEDEVGVVKDIEKVKRIVDYYMRIYRGHDIIGAKEAKFFRKYFTDIAPLKIVENEKGIEVIFYTFYYFSEPIIGNIVRNYFLFRKDGKCEYDIRYLYRIKNNNEILSNLPIDTSSRLSF